VEDEPSDEREIVRCAACQREVDEEEAQAQRWGYWRIAVDLYPFCPRCAAREFNAVVTPSE
jgi:endogenous inhibitor of DNA gyrase (YacG/DUF329 family)